MRVQADGLGEVLKGLFELLQLATNSTPVSESHGELRAPLDSHIQVSDGQLVLSRISESFTPRGENQSDLRV